MLFETLFFFDNMFLCFIRENSRTAEQGIPIHACLAKRGPPAHQATHSAASLLLHRYTAPLLCAVSLAITTAKAFGNPMRCLPDKGDPQFIEEYCWAMSTYSVEAATSSRLLPTTLARGCTT